MELKAYFVIFIVLILIIGMIIFGIWFTGILAKIVLTVGIILFLAWIIFIFELSMSMGSDV